MIDHDDSYTYNLVHLIAAESGELPVVVNHRDAGLLDRLREEVPSRIVLSPGPGHPALPADFVLGRAVFELGVPVLGVCLGMQALVVAFGGTVDRIAPAHGVVSTVDHQGTGLFDGIPAGFSVVRYHSLAAVEVPAALEVTARAEGVVMGVRHRELPVAGVQFHPESILSEYGDRLIRNFLEQR